VSIEAIKDDDDNVAWFFYGSKDSSRHGRLSIIAGGVYLMVVQ